MYKRQLYKGHEDEAAVAVRNLLSQEQDIFGNPEAVEDYSNYRVPESFNTETPTTTTTDNNDSETDSATITGASHTGNSSGSDSSSSSSSSNSTRTAVSSSDEGGNTPGPTTSTPLMNPKQQARASSKERKAQLKKAAAARAAASKAGTKTGIHDNTAVSMEDEETSPPPIKKMSLRERITEVYEKRVAETKASRGSDTVVIQSAQLEVKPHKAHILSLIHI